LKTEEERKAIGKEARKLFHELWTKEVGQPGYDKKKWMDLQVALQMLGAPV
jgi:hypothetical protein